MFTDHVNRQETILFNSTQLFVGDIDKYHMNAFKTKKQEVKDKLLGVCIHTYIHTCWFLLLCLRQLYNLYEINMSWKYV